VVKSPVSYFGGKQSLARRLVSAFPPHRHFVEVFGGSLAVLLAKQRSPQETVNDLDGHLQTFWRVLRDQPAELERVCSLTPHSRAERELAYAITDDLPEVEIARRVWIALTQGRTGSLTRTGWRHNTSPTPTPMPVVLQRYAGRIAPAARRLQGVSLECRPATEMVEAYGGDRRTLLYLDPPYLTNPGVRRGGEYRVEMRNPADHRKLLELCTEATAHVIISAYENSLYTEVLDGWYRYEIPTHTTQRGRRTPKLEIVWSNSPLDGLTDEDTDLDSAQSDETPTRCAACHGVLRQPKTGRRKVYCSPACRAVGYRARRDSTEV
jgi:DNA adenine methylase